MMLQGVPDKWGPKFEFKGGAVTRTHTGPNSIHFTAPSHMALVLFTAQPERQMALNSDRRTPGFAPVGSLEIVPADSELFAHWGVEKQNLLVAVEPERLQRLAGAEFDRDTFELRPPKLGIIDERAHNLALHMRYEVENAEMGCAESLDALVTLFATHLLRNYSSLKPTMLRPHAGGLSPSAWRRVNDYIQANLGKPLPLHELADIARLSPAHFGRAFKRTTGQTTHQYVISARLACARHLIINTEQALSDVARQAGFSSNSHLGSIMRQMWGVQPSYWRKNIHEADSAPDLMPTEAAEGSL